MTPRTYYRRLRSQIVSLLERHGDLTSREIADRVGVSLLTANSHIRTLIERGTIVRKSAKYQTIVVGLTP